ncbi:MAG: nitroreductase family protein [Clostridia bacterium]|nr:nitroreductase family protein [Clostridia bacterium]
MEFIDLIRKNRSYRNFDESVRISDEELRSFVNCARLSASAANRQPLKYYISNDAKTNALIQPLTAWAAKLRPERMLPDPGHNPTAFIVICVDTAILPNPQAADRDVGIAAQSILLAATSKGFGGLMIGAFNKSVKQALELPEQLEPALIIALGKPAESVVLEDAQGSIDYYRDAQDVHHVPKRPLSEIILGK